MSIYQSCKLNFPVKQKNFLQIFFKERFLVYVLVTIKISWKICQNFSRFSINARNIELTNNYQKCVNKFKAHSPKIQLFQRFIK